MDIIFENSTVDITQSKHIQYIKAPWQIICTAGTPGCFIKEVEYLPNFTEFSDNKINSTSIGKIDYETFLVLFHTLREDISLH